MAAVPTPLAPAYMTTVSPCLRSANLNNKKAVIQASGIAAPYVWLRDFGKGITWDLGIKAYCE